MNDENKNGMKRVNLDKAKITFKDWTFDLWADESIDKIVAKRVGEVLENHLAEYIPWACIESEASDPATISVYFDLADDSFNYCQWQISLENMMDWSFSELVDDKQKEEARKFINRIRELAGALEKRIDDV